MMDVQHVLPQRPHVVTYLHKKTISNSCNRIQISSIRTRVLNTVGPLYLLLWDYAHLCYGVIRCITVRG